MLLSEFLLTFWDHCKRTTEKNLFVRSNYYTSYKDKCMIISTSEFKLTHRHKNMVNLGHLFLTCLWKRTESTKIKQSLGMFGGWPSSSEQQLRKLLSPFLFANELREKFLPTGKDWSKLQLQDGVGCLMFVSHQLVVQPFQRSYLGSASTLFPVLYLPKCITFSVVF